MLQHLPAIRIKYFTTIFIVFTLQLLAGKVLAQTPFTVGNLAVLQQGNGSVALTSGGNPLFVVEVTTTGTTVQTVSVTSTGATALTESGTAASEGFMSRAANGQFLVIPGYNTTPPYGSSLSGTTSVAVSRGIGKTDGLGNYSFVKSDNSFFSGNNIRSATSDGGNNYWAGGAAGGLNLFVNGGTDIAELNSANTSDRCILIFNNQLYLETSSGIYSVTPTIPTVAGATSTKIITDGSTGGPFSYAFNSAGTVCYVADGSTKAAGGGVVKYTQSGGTWTAAYTMTVDATNGAQGLVVDFSGTNPVIYITTTAASANNLVKLTDNGLAATATYSVLATSPANTRWTSVAFAPFTATMSCAATAFCSGDSTVVTISGSPGGNVTYMIGATTQPTINIPSSGTYTLSTGALTTNTTYSLVSITDGIITQTLSPTFTVTVNPIPSPVSASPSANPICSGNNLTLNGAESGAATYSWAGPGGYTNTNESPSFTTSVTASGIYTFTATTSLGCSASATTAAVTVNPLPAPTISAAPISIIAGANSTLTFTGNTGDVVYYWDGTSNYSTTISGSGTSTVAVTPTVTTTYSVTGAISVTSCSVTVTGQSATVTVGNPTATISGATTICNGAGTNILFSGTAGATVTYTPDGGTTNPTVLLDGTTGTYTLAVSPTISTTYSLVSISYGAYTGSLSGSTMVSVNALPSGISGSLNVCINGTTSLSDLSGSGTWSSSNTAVGTVGSSSGTVSGLSVNTTTISFTLSATGCMTSSVVTVDPLPVVDAITGTMNVCPTATTLLGDGTGGGVWSSASANASIGTDGTVTGNTAGTATISYTVTSAFGCMSSVAAIVTVNPLASVGVITGGATIVNTGTTTLTDATPGGVWSSSDAGVATAGSTGIVTGVTLGTATISYTVTNCGSATATLNVTVSSTYFTKGDIVVEQLITNSSSGVAAAINLVEYTNVASSPVVTTFPVPSSAIENSGHDLTVSAKAVAEGFMSLSAERDRLVLAGYDAPAGTSGVASSTANRAITTVDLYGNFIFQYGNYTAIGANNVRGGCSFGTGFFESSNGSGIEYMNTDAIISTANTSSHMMQVFNGNIYFSSSSGAGFLGVNQMGSGISTSVGQTATNLAVDASANGTQGFAISPDGNTLYMASGTNGVLKYQRTGGAGTFSIVPTGYTLVSGAAQVCDSACWGLAVDFSTPNPTIYATTYSETHLISFQDAGSTVTSVTIIATTNPFSAPGGFRGVMLAPSVYAGVSGSATICAGDSANITISGNPHGTVTYNVNGGANQTVVLDSASATAIINTGALSAGAYTYSLVSITNPSGTASVTGTVTLTVNPVPVITTTVTANPLCAGMTVSLNATPSSGSGVYSAFAWSGPNTFSASTQNATIPTITPAADGVYSISVTDNNGCIGSAVTTALTVNPLPIITTTVTANPLCAGMTVSLNATPGSGSGVYSVFTWSGPNTFSASTQNASIPTITSASDGVYSISVTDNRGCIGSAVTTALTVNPLPIITTTVTANPLCAGMTVFINATPSSGSGVYSTFTWSGPNTFSVSTQNASIPTITSAADGVYSISVTDNRGCSGSAVTAALTVNPLPVITTTVTANPLCAGMTVSLNATPSSGSGVYSTFTWSGPNTFSVSTQNATIPTITPAADGVYSISVTDNKGCIGSAVTTALTVNPLPIITTTVTANPLCAGMTVSLNATPGSGSGVYSVFTWSGPNTFSASTQNATIPTITSAADGVYSISVTDNRGCSGSAVTAALTVNPLPVITTTVTANPLCAGMTVSLNATPGSGSGVYSTFTWSGPNTFSASTQNASISTITSAADGVYSISVTDNRGCSGSAVTAALTVNPLPVITTTVTANPLCAGMTVSLNATPGGGSGVYSTFTWSGPNTFSASTQNATIPTITSAADGVYSISVTDNNGCIGSAVTPALTVNPIPGSIFGTDSVCVGLTASLSDGTTGGAWSSSGSNTSVGTSGLVTGLLAGTSTLSYTLPAGCAATVIITVNPLPAALPATDTVLVGFAITLSEAGGGIWSSDNGNVTVGSSSGIVQGVTVGTSVITYTLGTGCMVTITVDVLLPPIMGNMSVCAGSMTTLSNMATGGVWSSGNSNVTIGSATGAVTGVIAGTSIISYISVAPADTVTAVVTVNPLPSAITGTMSVCRGLTTGLNDIATGGTWSSSNGNATIGSTGIVTGATWGIDTITYALSTGCIITVAITVDSLPSSITGGTSVCLGLMTPLADAGGGTWSSSNANAIVGSASGIVTGATAGTSTITYTLSTGCINATIVTVNPLPDSISGAGDVCVGSSVTLSDVGGGVWSSGNANTIIGSAGVVSGIAAGTSVITYTLPTNCIITSVIMVSPTVNPSVSITPGSRDTVCSGTSILFTATPVNGGIAPGYQWKVNGVNTGFTGSTYMYLPASDDTVIVILTSNAICAIPATASATDTITVMHTDTASVGITVDPGNIVCMGSPVLFTATGVNGGTSPVYIWLRNGAPITTGSAYGPFIPANNDNIYCELVSSQRCITIDTVASNHIVINVDTTYIPSVAIYINPGINIHSGEADTFTAAVANGGPDVSYQWVVNTTIIPAATNNIFSADSFSNNDSVTCQVTSAGPCGYASFNSVTIHVIPEGVAQYTMSASDIMLVPNPNKGQFTVKGALGTLQDEEISIEITDMLGQVVYKNRSVATGGNINDVISLGNTIANGMYLLNLSSGDDRKVFHFVIEQ